MEKAGIVRQLEILAILLRERQEPRSRVDSKRPASQNARIFSPHLSYNPDAK